MLIKNTEKRRFDWYTRNPYISKKELELLRFIDYSSAKNILEVGCGEGGNFFNLKSLGCFSKMAGVDIAFNKVSFASGNTKDVPVLCADGLRLPFKSSSFDVVFCKNLFHHVINSKGALLDELLRVCARGGSLVVIEGNGGNFLNRVFSLLFAEERGMRESVFHKINGLFLLRGYKAVFFRAEYSNLFRLILHHSFGLPALGRLKAVGAFFDWLSRVSRRVVFCKEDYAYMIFKVTKA